jgi:hypothetical protein
MNTTEILSEIKKLPIPEKRNLFRQLGEDLDNGFLSEEELREQEFEQTLLAEGGIRQIPPRWNEDDDFEPVEISGKPLSETVIEDRGE